MTGDGIVPRRIQFAQIASRVLARSVALVTTFSLAMKTELAVSIYYPI